MAAYVNAGGRGFLKQDTRDIVCNRITTLLIFLPAWTKWKGAWMLYFLLTLMHGAANAQEAYPDGLDLRGGTRQKEKKLKSLHL